MRGTLQECIDEAVAALRTELTRPPSTVRPTARIEICVRDFLRLLDIV